MSRAISIDGLKGFMRFITVNPNAAALSLILASAVIRVFLMLTLGFGIDEAYTLAHVRNLQWSYFDHPPLHLWIAHYAWKILGPSPTVRLPFVLLFAGTSWLCFSLTRHLFGARAGLWALFALNASAFFTLSPGGWVVPDGPLLFCLAAAASAAVRTLFPTQSDSMSGWKEWLFIGLWLGLAGLSKYSAVLFALGFLFFIVQSPRHRFWIHRPAPYLGAVIALIVLSPVFIWNYDNYWVSFLFQGGRSVSNGGIHPGYVISIIIGQVALLLPWIFLPLATAMIQLGRGSHANDPVRFLLCLAVPPIIIFTIVPLWGSRGLPHWPMPGWFFGFPLLGAWLVKYPRSPAKTRRWVFGSTAALAALFIIGVTIVDTGLTRLVSPSLLRYSDPTLESFNWTGLTDAHLLQPGSGTQPAFVIARNWMEGGKIDQALGGHTPVMVFSDDPREFAFDNDPHDYIGKDGAIVVEATHANEQLNRLAPYFEKFGQPEILSLGRNGMKEINLIIVPAIQLKSPYPLPYGKHSTIFAVGRTPD